MRRRVDDPEQLEEGGSQTAVATPPPAVMAAGNQAVARYIARLKEGEAPAGGGAAALEQSAGGEITASVGRGGANRPADVAVITGLLARVGMDTQDLAAAIEQYQKDKLGWKHGADGRVDPGGKTLRSLKKEAGGGAPSNEHGGGDGPAPAPEPAPSPAPAPAPAPSNDGPGPAPTPAPGPAPAPSPVGPDNGGGDGPAPVAGVEQFDKFASERAPLLAQMNSAQDDASRRTASQALRAFDAAHLPALRAAQQANGGRWPQLTPASMDAVLAAIQLEAATDAEGDLLADSQKVHERVSKAMGMDMNSAWCGMFTVDHFRHSGMDKDLASGFLHVDNVQDFFNYRHDRNPKRVPRWLWDNHKWNDLHTYHQERGSERHWLAGEEVWKGGDLDVRAGDVVLIDPEGDGKANHIVKVQSYDAKTNTLLTIGGNDGGYVINKKGKPASHKGESERQTEKRTRAQDATGSEDMTTEGWHSEYGAGGGHVGLSVTNVLADGKKRGTVFGIGRPSMIDFEDHTYDKGEHVSKPPAPIKE